MKTNVAAVAMWLGVGLSGCGGGVVLEDARGAGGGGGDGVTTSGSTSATTSSGGGATASSASVATVSAVSAVSASSSSSGAPALCGTHDDCPGGVCVFATGACAPSCAGELCESCGPGLTCDGCATSSCPGCRDCVGACVPTEPGRCDDDDRCPDGGVCLHPEGICAPSCDDCFDPNLVCDECATGSSCGDDDCVAACLPL